GTRVIEVVNVDVAYLSVVQKDAAKIKSTPKNRFQLVFDTELAAIFFLTELSAVGVRTCIVAIAIPDMQLVTTDDVLGTPTTYESLSHQVLLRV
ncbi:hypothetical protein HDU80_003996, partial [Chytriomyces hyalinus]